MEKYIKAKVKKSESLMIWASISSKGPGLIYFLHKNKKINSQEYINILKKKLQKSMNSTDTNILLHDKATVHTSKLTSNYLNRNNIYIITLPGCSPDLNPIENIFADLKRLFSKKMYHQSKIFKNNKKLLVKAAETIPNQTSELNAQ